MSNEPISNLPSDIPPVGIPHFPISGDDLAELERIVPELMWRMGNSLNDTRVRKQLEKVKDILSNVRWHYGPPLEIHTIPAEGDGP